MIYRCTVEGFGATLCTAVHDLTEGIGHEVERRSTLVSNELHTASQYVLRGVRSGRWYRVPGTYTRGSASPVGHVYGRSRRVNANGSVTTFSIVKDATRKDGMRVVRSTKNQGRMYQASAPGEAPANRTGVFRASFKGRSYVASRGVGSSMELHAVCESDYHVGPYLLGELLETGTATMAPRPYAQPTIDRAMPRIERIYNAPY